MTDPASTTLTAPRLRPGRRHRRLRGGGRAARGPRSGRTGCSTRDVQPVDDRPACRRGDRRPARLARRAGPFHGPDRRRSRRSAMPSWTRATRPRSSPGWAAAASRRTSFVGPSARSRATSTLRILDSTDPAYVSATLDDLDPLRTLVLIASKSGHDDRAERVPGLRLGPRDPALESGPPSPLRAPRRVLRGITDPGKRRRDRPLERLRARSSSTRPTSAAGTRR